MGGDGTRPKSTRDPDRKRKMPLEGRRRTGYLIGEEQDHGLGAPHHDQLPQQQIHELIVVDVQKAKIKKGKAKGFTQTQEKQMQGRAKLDFGKTPLIGTGLRWKFHGT